MSVTVTTKIGSAGTTRVSTIQGELEGKSQADLIKERTYLDTVLARKQHAPAQVAVRRAAVHALIS